MQTLEQISMACLRKSCNQPYFSASGQAYFIYIATHWFSFLKGRVKKKLHHLFSCLSLSKSANVILCFKSFSMQQIIFILSCHKGCGIFQSHAQVVPSIFDEKKAILLIRIILYKLASTFKRNFCVTFDKKCHNSQ